MSLVLGVDTGGTYTDAVLIRDDSEVVASAKALTTRHDLAEGIGEAVSSVLRRCDVPPSEIAMTSLSTTLATNALVEGQRGRIALILIGFHDRDLEKHGLGEALKGDPVLVCAGGHDHAGAEVASLDEDAIRTFLELHGAHVTAFAVAAQFATRNPSHEQRTEALIDTLTGHPVSASHQLSARLNGPKRAMTALLNACLVGMIARLIDRAQSTCQTLGITAPMMVVRGDGALISAEQARTKPIETILSGPAASLVGARWLTGAQDAIVSDIGGTTTDVAVLRGGRPSLDSQGAQVGAYRTMVEAVAMRTTGLGGDSQVDIVSGGLKGQITLGPRRVIPVSLLAREAPETVHEALDVALRATSPGEYDARFVRAVGHQQTEGLSPREAHLLERIDTIATPLTGALRSRVDLSALNRLVERGIVQLGGVTPSDAAHVLGFLTDWDIEAARKALTLLARKRSGAGSVLAATPEDMARMIVDQLTIQTRVAILETVFTEEETEFGDTPSVLARHTLLHRALDNHQGILRLDAGLAIPVVGLGASARSYYPAVGLSLGAQMILPEHAGVANAIGAVVGRVTMRRSGTVTAPSQGLYRVHFDTGPQDFSGADSALAALEDSLRTAAQADAAAAGAVDIEVRASRDIRHATVEERQVFIEATVTVEATGRPRLSIS